MAKLKRGDVVEYVATGLTNMKHWDFLTGRIGIITGYKEDSYLADGTSAHVVRWISFPPGAPDDGDTRKYDDRLLRKIGHIKLPEADGGV